MIFGAVGDCDRSVTRAINELSQHAGHPTACSIEQGVAIAAWSGSRVGSAMHDGDYASIGRLLGNLPGPDVELPGDFAFVGRKGRLLRLARGRFSGRPLYWLRMGSTVLACSRLLPLGIMARHRLGLNLEHLLALFDPLFSLYRAPLPFVDVQRVPMNTVVDIGHSGAFESHPGPFELEAAPRLSARELPAAVRHEFEAAVARQCGHARKVAVLTSGGVDSSNLLSVAVRSARHHGTADPVPVNVDVGGEGDDRPHFRTLCRHLDVTAIRIAPSDGVAFTGRERVADGSAHSVFPQSTVFSALKKARDAGAELVMTGDGAEFLFAAEPPIFGDFLLRKPLPALRWLARLDTPYLTRIEICRRFAVGPLARRFLPPSIVWLRGLQRELRATHRSLRRIEWAGPVLRSFLSEPKRYPVAKPIQSQRDYILHSASSELLSLNRESFSRWEAATGMPIVFPYLDDTFVKFVGSLPSEALFAGTRERGLLRESMAGLVPDSIRYRGDKSRPYRGFAELFVATGGYDGVKELVTMRELERLGVVKPAPFRAAFARFAENPLADTSSWATLGAALTAEAYVRWFRDLTTAPESTSFEIAPSFA